jgi:hypothetical protein
MTPSDLLVAARELMTRPDMATAGVWPRTSALLARQALEQALRLFWDGHPDTAGLASRPMRTQLICLPCYIDKVTAAQVAYTWAALSSACHYHSYELAPTAAELTGWISDVGSLITQIEASVGSRACPAQARESAVVAEPSGWK